MSYCANVSSPYVLYLESERNSHIVHSYSKDDASVWVTKTT